MEAERGRRRRRERGRERGRGRRKRERGRKRGRGRERERGRNWSQCRSSPLLCTKAVTLHAVHSARGPSRVRSSARVGRSTGAWAWAPTGISEGGRRRSNGGRPAQPRQSHRGALLTRQRRNAHQPHGRGGIGTPTHSGNGTGRPPQHQPRPQRTNCGAARAPGRRNTTTTRCNLRREDGVTVQGRGRRLTEDDPPQLRPQPPKTEQWALHTLNRSNTHRPHGREDTTFGVRAPVRNRRRTKCHTGGGGGGRADG